MWTRWTKGGPAASMFTVSDSGWMEGANFVQWFEKMFLPAVQHLTTKYPVVLFFDGHHSHISLKLIELARSNHVHLICFPPHCTHILQPLDVSVYGPLKTAWRNVMKDFQLETCAATATKEDFPELLYQLWEKSFLPKHLVSGFLKCGLCPLSREAIPSHRLSKADPHKSLPTQQHLDVEAPTSPSEVVIQLSGECTVNNAVTPIRLHLRGYFSQLIHKNKQSRCQQDKAGKRRIKPKFYGEALTTDEIYDRIAAEEQNKKTSKDKAKASKKGARGSTKVSSRKNRSPNVACKSRSRRTLTKPPSRPDTSEDDDGVCEECGRCYKDDKKEIRKYWIGCDTCERWFHCNCVGLCDIPKGFWSCKYCS